MEPDYLNEIIDRLIKSGLSEQDALILLCQFVEHDAKQILELDDYYAYVYNDKLVS